MIRALYLKILSCLMVVIFPSVLLAGDQPAAMVYSHGAALLNGSNLSRPSAIFSGDLIETSADSAANINSSGSIVLVLKSSLIKYQGNSVDLEHGRISVSTSKALATRAGDITVTPSARVWTEFDVKDVDGTVQIAARKGYLTISDETGTTTTLAQGQQTTRDDSSNEQKKKKKKAAGAAAPAQGGILDSPWAIGIGGAAVVGATAWVLARGDDPVSASK
jgi:hypothetical protein